jgi:hypothetical protein
MLDAVPEHPGWILASTQYLVSSIQYHGNFNPLVLYGNLVYETFKGAWISGCFGAALPTLACPPPGPIRQ